MAKKPSLLEKIKAEPRSQPGYKTWFDKLPDDDVKQELLGLRVAFQSGEVTHGKAQVWRACCRELNLTISRCAFENWLSEKPAAK